MKFNEIDPLVIDGLDTVAEVHGPTWVAINNPGFWRHDDATSLRDWLNRALPDQVCEWHYASDCALSGCHAGEWHKRVADSVTFCPDCGKRVVVKP